MLCGRLKKITNNVRLVVLVSLTFIKFSHGTLYQYGIENGDVTIDWPSWDNGSTEIRLTAAVPVFGQGWLSDVWINAFGSISLNRTISSDLQKVKDNILMAPFFSKSQQGAGGKIYYRQNETDFELFQIIAKDVSNFADYVTGGFTPTYALVVTWENVTSFEDFNKTNTFQLVLTSDGFRTFLLYNYLPLQWISSENRFAVAGVHVVGDVVETCSIYLPGSGTDKVYRLATTTNTGKTTGKHVIDITFPLQCSSGFESRCGEFPPKGKGFFRPEFELTSANPLEWNFFLTFVCKPGLHISMNVTSQRIECLYDSDYYDYAWNMNTSDCIDLNATRIFKATMTGVVNSGDDVIIAPANLKDLVVPEVNKMLANAGVVDVVNSVESIQNGTSLTLTTPSNASTNGSTVVVEFMIYIPTFSNKRLTNLTLKDKLTGELKSNNDIKLVEFKTDPPVSVVDMTSSCLQSCLCRNLKDPILCRTGVFKPDLQPDACCGICGSVMKPYASSIKACCNNSKLYDPTKSICCDGVIRKGDKCPG